MGESNSKEMEIKSKPAPAQQLVWPDLNNYKSDGGQDNHDGISTRYRGFLMASAYAACLGRKAASHPHANALAKQAIAINDSVVRGDMMETRSLVDETLKIHLSVPPSHGLGCLSKWHLPGKEPKQFPVDDQEREELGGATRKQVIALKLMHDTGNFPTTHMASLRYQAALATHRSLKFKPLAPAKPIDSF
jgi:hypothetical protein